LFVLLTGRESRVLAAAELGIGDVLLRDSFGFEDRPFGDRYRGLKG